MIEKAYDSCQQEQFGGHILADVGFINFIKSCKNLFQIYKSSALAGPTIIITLLNNYHLVETKLSQAPLNAACSRFFW